MGPEITANREVDITAESEMMSAEIRSHLEDSRGSRERFVSV